MAIWVEIASYLYIPVAGFLIIYLTAEPVNENDPMGTLRMVERPWWIWPLVGFMGVAVYLMSVFYTRRRNNNEINKRVLWKALVNLLSWVIFSMIIMNVRELIWD